MARRRETGAVVDQPAAGQGQAGFTAPSGQPDDGAGVTGASRGEQGGPTLEQIAERAYEIYQSRGGTDGQDMDDWLQAERELRRGLQDE